MQRYRVETLPQAALDAAAAFSSDHLPAIRRLLDEGRAEKDRGGEGPDALTILLPGAPRDHRGWRLAILRDLARAGAPDMRVNALSGGSEEARRAGLAYLADAHGVTGQLLDLS